jgi:hypothetical protein
MFLERANPRIGSVLSKNASAVWLVPVEDRLFACAFGYGRTLIAPGTFEEDFGLKVTLNCVDPTKVHSIDRTTLDTIAICLRRELFPPRLFVERGGSERSSTTTYRQHLPSAGNSTKCNHKSSP